MNSHLSMHANHCQIHEKKNRQSCIAVPILAYAKRNVCSTCNKKRNSCSDGMNGDYLALMGFTIINYLMKQ